MGSVCSPMGWQWFLVVVGSRWVKMVAKYVQDQNHPSDCFGC